MMTDAHSHELEEIYQRGSAASPLEASPGGNNGAASAVHAHTASGTGGGGLMPIVQHCNNDNHGNGGCSSVGIGIGPGGSNPPGGLEVEAEVSEDPYFMGAPTVGTGMEEVSQNAAAQAKRRALTFSGSEVQRRVLVLIDESDANGTSEPQQQELLKLCSHWYQAYGASLNIQVKLFTYVPPRSNWRYLILQSPSSARGKTCQQYNTVCQKIKLRLEAAIASGNLFANTPLESSTCGETPSGKKTVPTLSVEIHVDSETASAAGAVQQVIKSYRPSLVLMSDRKDQSSLTSHVVSTSQEILIQQIVAELKTIVCVAKPLPAPPVHDWLYDAAKAQPRTFVCCVNTAALFSHLPIAVASAASLASSGDHLIIFAAYQMTADATGALMSSGAGGEYSTGSGISDWTDRVRGEMKATKDTVERLLTNVTRSYSHLKLKVSSHISDHPFEAGLTKYVHEIVDRKTQQAGASQKGGGDHNVVVVVGNGKLKDYFGAGLVHAWKGDQPDRVRRQLPDVTLLVAPPSKAGY